MKKVILFAIVTAFSMSVNAQSDLGLDKEVVQLLPKPIPPVRF